jgi:hypothetical protein
MAADIDIVERLRSLADCDARSGEPLGKCMREAADTITSLRSRIEELERERDEASAMVAVGLFKDVKEAQREIAISKFIAEQRRVEDASALGKERT